jgi:hypothetical protein
MAEHLFFHIWCLGEERKMRLYCGESDADATITAEWAVKLSADFLCQKCLRMSLAESL